MLQYYDACAKYYELINKLTAKLGKRGEVIDILLESGKHFQASPACILYLVYEDVKNPNVIWAEDLWSSKEEHTAALANPEIRTHVTKAVPLLENMPEQIELDLAGGKRS